MHLPDIWGEGQLFAFSGVDGDSNWSHHFLGSLTAGPGVVLHLRPDITLSAVPEGDQVREIRPRYVLGDAFDVDVILQSGRAERFALAAADWQSLSGLVGPGLRLQVEPPLGQMLQTGSGWIALAADRGPGGTHFALALQPTDKFGLEVRVHTALQRNLDQVLRRRAEFVRALSLEGTAPPTDERTYRKAASVLKANAMSPEGAIRHRWTTPDRWPHRHMWLWDSVFHALGWRYLSRLWAEEPLLALFDHQEEDGRIPLSAVPNGPNPEQSQPPLIAWGVWELHRQLGPVDFLRECYEPLERYLEWFCRERDRNGNGLLEWHKDEESAQCHCGESGYDNSPRFDHPGLDDALDLSCYVANEMRLLAQIGRRIGAEAADDWQQRGDDLARRINELLWDEQRGMYFDRRDSGEWVAIKTTAGFMPLWAGVASPKQAARLVEHLRDEREFATPFPVPTVAADEPTHSDDMWRGPTWINTNYLIFRGLVDYGFREEAAALREVTMRQIQHWYERTGCLWEFYDCQGQTDPYHLHRKGGSAGVGHWTPTIADYGWTAALYIALAHEAPVG